MTPDSPFGGLGGRLKRLTGLYGWDIAPFGPDGRQCLHAGSGLSVIVTRAEHEGAEWVHASLAHPNRMPSWEEVRAVKTAVFGDRFAYMVFPPSATYVNIHDYALHVWGRWDESDGRALPDFVGDWFAKTGELSI